MAMIISQVRIMYLLEIGGEIPQRVKPAQVLCSRGVSMEEYLNDIFKLKRRYSCALLYKSKSLSLFRRPLIHQTTKSGWKP